MADPRARPILFSAPMVRAILDGRKTQTRRLVKAPHAADADAWIFDGALGLWESGIEADYGRLGHGEYVRCPYGAPGDRLWVRERFASLNEHGNRCAPRDAVFALLADGAQVFRDGSRFPGLTQYAAGAFDRIKWRPSIHMPRWASRITLEVTGVRIERLQAITEADVFAEGVQLPIGGCEPECARKHPGQVHALVNALTPHKPALDPKCSDRDYAVAEFAVLWDSINGERAPWASNPWVWVVGFRRLS